MKFEDSELDEYSVQKGDLLICEGGYPGRGAIWESEDESFKFQKALHRLRFYTNTHSSFYLFYLDLLRLTGKIDHYCTGSGIRHLTGVSLKNMPVPLPPKVEIEKIVRKLSMISRQMGELESRITDQIDLKEKLLQKVLLESLKTEDHDVNSKTDPKLDEEHRESRQH